MEGGKPEKNLQSKARTNNKRNPHIVLSRNQTRWEASALTIAPPWSPYDQKGCPSRYTGILLVLKSVNYFLPWKCTIQFSGLYITL